MLSFVDDKCHARDIDRLSFNFKIFLSARSSYWTPNNLSFKIILTSFV